MWRKLLSDQDIDSITEGNIIIKYPIDGEPAQEIDLSSEEIFMLYEVCQITGAEVLLQVPAEPHSAETGEQGAVCLSKRELVQQKVWWIK
jgi:hypothetical protein